MKKIEIHCHHFRSAVGGGIGPVGCRKELWSEYNDNEYQVSMCREPGHGTSSGWLIRDIFT